MALQDLTPQLRTRLSRMERAVGWFVFVATALLVFGFAYYIYTTAARKGWFTPKLQYQTSLNDASGLKVGDPIRLMGFNVGQVTEIIPNEPGAWYGVTVKFSILKPNYGYIWDDSQVKVSSDLLGNRTLEITKGISGVATVLENSNRVAQAMLISHAIHAARREVLAEMQKNYPGLSQTNQAKFDWLVMDELKRRQDANPSAFYTNLNSCYWIPPQESLSLNDRLERVANTVEQAMPNILGLTNQLYAVLNNTANMTSNLNVVVAGAQPMVADLRLISAQLREPGGAVSWALGTNGAAQTQAALTNVNTLLANTDTNLATLVAGLAATLDHLAGITSNLNAQVQANTNILSNVSQAIVDADDLVQGLKRHWLLRSAFKTNAPPTPADNTIRPAQSPRGAAN